MTRRHLPALLTVLTVAALVLSGCPAKPTDVPDASAPPLTGPAGPSTDAEPTDAAPAATGDWLTKEKARAFIESIDDGAIAKIVDGIEDGLGVEDDDSPEAIRLAVKKAADSDELTELVTGYGFEDAAEWSATATVVMPAYMTAIKGAGGLPTDGDEDIAFLKEAFGTPSDADLAIVTEVMEEQLDAGMEDMGDAPADESAE